MCLFPFVFYCICMFHHDQRSINYVREWQFQKLMLALLSCSSHMLYISHLIASNFAGQSLVYLVSHTPGPMETKLVETDSHSRCVTLLYVIAKRRLELINLKLLTGLLSNLSYRPHLAFILCMQQLIWYSSFSEYYHKQRYNYELVLYCRSVIAFHARGHCRVHISAFERIKQKKTNT